MVRLVPGEANHLSLSMRVGNAAVMHLNHLDIAHQLAEFLGQPVQRGDDHFLETAGFDLDHQFIVQRSGQRQSALTGSHHTSSRLNHA